MPKRPFSFTWRLPTVIGLVVIAAATAFAQQPDVIHDRMKKDIFFLASPECEGRGVDTKGINIAADYIANQITQAGLKPGGKNGTYWQPFTIAAGKGAVQGKSTLTLKGPAGQTTELVLDKDFQVLPGLGSGKVEAPIVFVGYGVTLPSADKDTPKEKSKDNEAKKDSKDADKKADTPPAGGAGKKGGVGGGGGKKGGGGAQQAVPPVGEVTWVGYDDFQGVDVKGKIVVVLRRVPRWDNDVAPFGGDKTAHAGLQSKISNSEKHGAAAVLVVNDRSEAADGDKFITETTKAGIPVAQLRRGVLDMLLVSAKGTSLPNLEKDIDIDLKPRSGPLTGWTGALSTTTKQTTYNVKNIVGVLEGSGPLANETVCVGAHYDHLGFGLQKKTNNMYPGADDNGSGSTTIMELARRFGALKDRQGRRLVFLWFSGEERGLLGSKHYCEDPMFPLESTIAMVNLDMVGRLKDEKEPKLYAEGFNTGKGLKELLDKLNGDFGFKIVGPHPQNIYGRSDQASFYRKNVPGMFFFTDFHPDYHKPGDTPDKINVAGMMKVAALTEKLIAHLAATPERPEYIAGAIKGKGGAGAPKAATAKLSLNPDYTDKSAKGVLIESVTAGGPAAKGGIMAGDRIISIGTTPTPGQSDYLTALQQLRPGMVVEITILRKGEELKLKVTPE